MGKNFLGILCLTIIIVIVSSCTYAASNPVKGEETAETMRIAYDDIPWEEEVGDFTAQLDIKPETALKIAELLLTDYNAEPLREKTSVLRTVEGENIYVIRYLPDRSQAGGDINIAINSKTGEVLKMWAGE